MNRSSKLVRIAVLASSLTLFMGYVAYSHFSVKRVSSNSADEFVFLSTKSITKPVFSMRGAAIGSEASKLAEVPDMFIRPIIPGTKSGPVDFFRTHPWELVGFGWHGISLDPFPGARVETSLLTPFSSWEAKVSSWRAEMDSRMTGKSVVPADPFDPSSPPADGDPFAAPAPKTHASP